jgi:hypothetical protein
MERNIVTRVWGVADDGKDSPSNDIEITRKMAWGPVSSRIHI